MKKMSQIQSSKVRFWFCLLMTLFVLAPAAAQAQQREIWVRSAKDTSLAIAWQAKSGATSYTVSFQADYTGGEVTAGITSATTYRIGGLRPRTLYTIWVAINNGGFYQFTARTTAKEKKVEPRAWAPMPVTCPHLPPSVIVSGYMKATQCQLVNEAGIGQMDVIKRGVIDAVDIWNFVPDTVEVCFREHGWVVFLDAGYMPRMAMELEHTHHNGLTCATIDRAGTVALVASAPPVETPVTSDTPAESEAPAQSDAPPTLPVFEAIPLSDCQIKLVETLFLRETPGGEIIGLVWLNSEVPAFEINGYWYKVEFEGLTGYISRYHRKVLRGGCG